jgi:alpha-mannosidase
MKLRVFNENQWKLWLDFRIILGLIKRLPEKSVQRSLVIECANQAIDAHAADNNKSRKILKKELSKHASPSDLKVNAIGHAHIDTAWLWPVRESIRKCARTFVNQLSLIEKYPNYVFGASQPQHYQFMKDYYSEIFKRIQIAVKKGQWECQGGMWVEADCNLISGESMVRQIIHGKNFFMDEFNVNIDNLWLPDVFGYSAALPQILQKSGIKYFLTQKLSWSQFNDFPHHTFIWEGIDGSEVLTHFPPENTYNSELDSEFLIPAQNQFKEKHILDEFISLFGVGDGGGGPKAENIELGQRLENLESVPQVKFGSAKDFFHRLDQSSDKLKKWVGELYLELHRGTLTTQARIKQSNRQLENTLRLVEMLYSSVSLSEYPQNELDRIWKVILLNQFHDIIPGSSITMVYDVTHKEYNNAKKELGDLINKISEILFEKDKDFVTFFNPNHHKFNDLVKVRGVGKTQVQIAPYSFKSIQLKELMTAEICNNLILENAYVCYEFNKKGQLISGFDKELNLKIITEEGNTLTLYDDHPNNWDAWDIDIFYEEAVVEKLSGKKASESQLSFKYSFGRKSSLEQSILLSPHSKRLDFITHVNWYEKHRMLRVAFPVNVQSDQASFDIQYGFVKRPTHRNTSWDMARFEVVGHKYADLSNEDFGVALLNDCKYGYKVYGNVLDLNLLRSPNNPDPDADMGEHDFTYSLLPHTERLIESNVISEATMLNRPIHTFVGYKSSLTKIPITLKGVGLTLEVIKKAEKTNELIIRVVESLGKFSMGELESESSNTKWIETNLMEWEDGDLVKSKKLKIKLNPFEIKTWKVST